MMIQIDQIEEIVGFQLMAILSLIKIIYYMTMIFR